MRLQNRRVLGSTVLALGAALLLAGCGAGQITQTDRQEPAVNGAFAQVKTLYIRDAVLQYPPNGTAYAAGSSAAVSLTVVNDGPTDDELLSVTSDAAAGASVQGSKIIVTRSSLVIAPPETPGQPPASVPANPVSSAPATGTSAPVSSSAPSSPASPPPAATSPTTTSPVTSSSPVPPGQVGRASVVLQGLVRPVWPGQTVRITLVFRDAGAVTFDLPVGAPDHPHLGEIHTEVAPATPEGH